MGAGDTTSHATVWIAEDLDPDELGLYTGRFHGHLDHTDRIEEFDDLSVDDAITWARARASVVLIRAGDYDYHSAGANNPAPEELPAWPPADLELGRRRARGFEALDNTESDDPVLWDVRIEAELPDHLDPRLFHDAIRDHPATRDVQAPAPGYHDASAALLVETSTIQQANTLASAIADHAVASLLETFADTRRQAAGLTNGFEVYPHRPDKPVTGPGITV